MSSVLEAQIKCGANQLGGEVPEEYEKVVLPPEFLAISLFHYKHMVLTRSHRSILSIFRDSHFVQQGEIYGRVLRNISNDDLKVPGKEFANFHHRRITIIGFKETNEAKEVVFFNAENPLYLLGA